MANHTMTIPRISDMLKKAPEGLNPYSFAIMALENLEKPPSGPIFRSVLTIFACISAAIMLCCLGILVVPFFQGEVGGSQHNWIVKRKYSGSRANPYFILNNGLVIGLSYLFGGILFQCYVALQFNTMDSNRQTSQFSWIEILKLPGSCATFIQAFTMLFISTSNPSQGGTKRYSIPPGIFNFLLIGFPALTAVASIFLIVHKASLVQKQDVSYNVLINLLTDAAKLWDGGEKILSESRNFLLQATYEVFSLDTFLKNRSRIRIGLFWAFMAIPSILFYVGGVIALVTTVYQPIKTPKKLQPANLNPNEIKTVGNEMENGPIILGKDGSRKLSRSLKFLWLHYFSMSMALSMDAATSMVFYLNKDNLKDIRLARKFFVTNLSSSIFTLVAMIILLARIIGDGKEAKNSASNCTSGFTESNYSASKVAPGNKQYM
ncbi:hypothetical protein PGT21_002995 [Puccinia graminis f. sp. tritici]|nr:hypothetical protein PGT21_002995 [Puccinia graminis f. sp. tritici]